MKEGKQEGSGTCCNAQHPSKAVHKGCSVAPVGADLLASLLTKPTTSTGMWVGSAERHRPISDPFRLGRR